MVDLKIMNLAPWCVNVTRIKQNIMTYRHHTKDQQSYEKYRVVAESDANA